VIRFCSDTRCFSMAATCAFRSATDILRISGGSSAAFNFSRSTVPVFFASTRSHVAFE
jgi:hypothetical protein